MFGQGPLKHFAFNLLIKAVLGLEGDIDEGSIEQAKDMRELSHRGVTLAWVDLCTLEGG